MDYKVLTQVFSDAIPFNKFLGLRLDSIEEGKATISIDMRPEFVGDPVKKILHGGVISTLLDVTGGLTAFTVLDWPKETSLNTIDMRVDYVRMGKGESFHCEGSVVRKGNRIIVTRTELKNDQDVLIALGTATYHIFTTPETVNVKDAFEKFVGGAER